MWPKLIFEIVDSIIWISQSFSVQKVLQMLASPTSLAFKLGAHLSGANVVMSSQSYMASAYANQEVLPSNHGGTFGVNCKTGGCLS